MSGEGCGSWREARGLKGRRRRWFRLAEGREGKEGVSRSAFPSRAVVVGGAVGAVSIQAVLRLMLNRVQAGVWRAHCFH